MSSVKPITHLILNGKELPCVSGKQFGLVDPSTGEEWLKIDEAGPEDLEIAVEHAEKAWPDWHSQPAYAKAAIFRAFGELVLAHKDELAYLEAKCNGKLISSMTWDVVLVSMACNYFASLIETDHAPASTNLTGFLNFVTHYPFGVTAGIIPWNIPMQMFIMKVGPSVAAGNAIILKSSEKAPLSSLYLGHLAVKAGFPPGLIQVLSGFGGLGAAMASHMKIRKISFTGSVNTGKAVMRLAAESNLKNVTLELGGKTPVIIFPDANLEEAVEACAQSLATNNGQTCTASTRLYVHSSVKTDFVNAYSARLKALFAKPGSHMDPETTAGPVADELQYKRIRDYLSMNEGKPVIGGGVLDRAGYFIEPTVFTDVSDDASINREEIFGPVAIVHSFETEEEAVTRANDTEYGLYGAVFTKDIDRALRVSAKIQTGLVGVNCTSPSGAMDTPFGGFKQSGVGRELGGTALSPWQETKSTFIKISTQ